MDLKEREETIKKLAEDVEKISKYLDSLAGYLQKQEYSNLLNDIKVSTIIEALIKYDIVDKEKLDELYQKIAKETQDNLNKAKEENEEASEQEPGTIVED